MTVGRLARRGELRWWAQAVHSDALERTGPGALAESPCIA